MPEKNLLRRRLERPEIAKRHRRQRIGYRAEISRYLREPRSTLATPLVHVDRAVEFELDGVQPACRIAVMLGDEAAGIGLVAADRIAEPAHGCLDHVGQQRSAARAVAVADDNVRAPRLVARHAY